MQKFTRALSREVEVGGERLAVTFSAEGLSVRPVRSRRPPATLSWAALVCAAGQPEPDPDRVAAALAALKGGSGKASPANPPPAEKADLAATLARLEAWLTEHRPRYHEGLRPGASADDLAALEKALGFPLPEELRTWLGWHDAQSPDLMGAFRDSFALMSAREIAEAHADLVAEPEPGWRREWVPFLDDGQGDYVCLD